MRAVLICCLLAAFALGSASFGPHATAQQTDSSAGPCLRCHIAGEEAGGGGAPPVDPEVLLRGAHAGLACGQCHLNVPAPHPRRIPGVDCARCHEENAAGFQRGIHWRQLNQGNTDAPTCTRCHGTHDIEPVQTITSLQGHQQVTSICGGCHRGALRRYLRSAHARALEDADKRELAPTCTSCHGEHTIFATQAPASSVSAARQPATCGGCHDDPALTEALGLKDSRQKSYGETMHGLRSRFGSASAATCSDCHGAHLVLPASDPASTIAAGNIVRTCGRCHAGANENFVAADIHVEATPESSFGVFAVRWFYIVFIVVLGVGFVAHIAFDLVGIRRRRRRSGRDERDPARD